MIKKERKQEIKKAILYGLLFTVILTWPIFPYFFWEIPGRGPDTYQVLARTLMAAQKIEAEGWIKTLAWQKDSDFWGILPSIGYVQYFLGEKGGYNFCWLASFFLAFLGTWLFTREITRSKIAAYTAGLVFAFAPFHFAHGVATNIGAMNYQWIPWLALFLYWFVRDKSWLSALGTATFSVLIIATEHQLLAFTMIFLVFYFPFVIYLRPDCLKNWRFWSILVSGLVLLFLVGAIQFNKIWEIAHSENNFLIPPFSQVENYSADLIDFILPAEFHPLWGEHFNVFRAETASNEEGRQTFYLGFSAIILFFSGLVLLILARARKQVSSDRKWMIFWAAMFVFFTVLSLGPTLHIAGQEFFKEQMPQIWLYKNIPFWNYIRTTSRIFVIALLAWSMMLGLSAKYLMARLEKIDSDGKNRIKLAIFGLFFGLLFVEFLSFPVSRMDLGYSQFYDQLQKDKEKYFLLEVPGSTSYDFGSYTLYTARKHLKEKVDGIDFARTEKDRWAFQKNTPIISKILYSFPEGGEKNPENPNGDIIVTDFDSIGQSILNFYYIRYVTVSKREGGSKFTDEARQKTVEYLGGNLGLKKVYEDDSLIAFEVAKNIRSGAVLALENDSSDSWGEKEGTGRSRARFAKDGAAMKVVNLETASINVKIDFKASIKYLREVEFLLDGVSVKKISLEDFKGDYSLVLNQLTPGEHRLEMKIRDEKGKAVDDYEMSRGVKFSQFQITKL